MGSRDKDQTTSHHQPLLSSLVVGPSASDGADGGASGGRGRGGGSDYEPGEVRRELHPYSRSDRYKDEPGWFLFLMESFYLFFNFFFGLIDYCLLIDFVSVFFLLIY